MQALSSSKISFAGTAVQARRTQAKRSRTGLMCHASTDQPSSRRQLLGLGALLAAAAAVPSVAVPSARADLTADLLEKSKTNKALHDKQRLATSGEHVQVLATTSIKRLTGCLPGCANFHNSRTVADNTCAFPYNLFGCGNKQVAGNVKYIQDDFALEYRTGSYGLATEVYINMMESVTLGWKALHMLAC
eukprot:jgi/Astpho2/8235/Aster-01323